jgi:hypothetical protein
MHGKHTVDYSRVCQIVEAMENLLTYEQQCRIRNAAQWGGFDEAMKSLTRVSNQLTKERTAANIQRASLEGQIIGLQDEVQMQKNRADRTMAAIDGMFKSAAPLSPVEPTHYQNIVEWGHVRPMPVFNLADANGRPFPPMDSRKVLLTEDGLIDQGALHRAIAIARELCRMGRWDGQEFIRIADPYGIYNSLDQYVYLVTVAGELTVRKALAPQTQEA